MVAGLLHDLVEQRAERAVDQQLGVVEQQGDPPVAEQRLQGAGVRGGQAAGQVAQRGGPGGDGHHAQAGQPGGDREQRRAATGPGRTSDEQAVRRLHGDGEQLVTADAEQDGAGREVARGRAQVGQPHGPGQQLHPSRRVGGRRDGLGETGEGRGLRRTGRVGVEQRDLGGQRRWVERRGGERPAAPGGQRDPGQPSRDARGDVVGRVGHPQHQALRHERGRAPDQAAAVGGEHDVQPGRGALAQELVGQLDQAAGVDVLEGGGERLPPVEQQQQVWQPVAGVGGGTLLGQPAQPACRQERLPPSGLAGQVTQQPVEALVLVEPHHGAGVRQVRQPGEAAAAVDGVQVHVVRAGGAGQRRGQAAQDRRAAGAGRTHHEQVRGAVQVERQRPSALLGRHVEQPVRQRAHPAGCAGERVRHLRQVLEPEDPGQCGQPRGAGGGQSELPGGGGAGGHEQAEIGVLTPFGTGRARQRVPQLGDRAQLDGRCVDGGPRRRAAAADPGRLEGGEVAGTGAQPGPTGRGAADGRGDGGVQDVA